MKLLCGVYHILPELCEKCNPRKDIENGFVCPNPRKKVAEK